MESFQIHCRIDVNEVTAVTLLMLFAFHLRVQCATAALSAVQVTTRLISDKHINIIL